MCSSQLERDVCTPSNVTLGYYVMSERTVYMVAAVVETLTSYGFDKLLSDLRQHAPVVLAIPVPVASWQSTPGIHLQLKTGEAAHSVLYVIVCTLYA